MKFLAPLPLLVLAVVLATPAPDGKLVSASGKKVPEAARALSYKIW